MRLYYIIVFCFTFNFNFAQIRSLPLPIGSYSESEENETVELNKYKIPENFGIHYAFNDEMLGEEIEYIKEIFCPIGWSGDGKYFAYWYEPFGEVIGGYNAELIIFDISANQTVDKWIYKESNEQNWDEISIENREGIWFKKKYFIENKLTQYNIVENDNLKYLPSPIKMGTSEFDTRLIYAGEGKSIMGGVTGLQIVTLRENSEKEKFLYQKELGENSDLVRSFIEGGIINTQLNQILFIKVNEILGWEGPPNSLEIEIIGCNLDE